MRSPRVLTARVREKVAAGEALATTRRHLAMRADQVWVLSGHCLARVVGRRSPDPFDGSVRIALITVNFGTMRFIKLLLLTLAEQSAVGLVHRIVIVDNGSAEEEVLFLRRLTRRLVQVDVVERHHLLDHARGLRAGVRRLQVLEREADAEDRCNVYLFCDPDVVFRSPRALAELAASIAGTDAALAGEWRGTASDPDIQASFVAVRSDAYQRTDVIPPVYHGSPTRWMQRSIVRHGLRAVDFPANHAGLILHRGRGAVGAAAHFMGVADGARTWAAVESRFARLLTVDDEDALVTHLTARLTGSHRRSSAPPAEHLMVEPFDPTQPVEWSPGVLHRRTPGAIVVLQPPGEPLRLSGFAPALWPMFETPTRPDDVIDAITDSFAVDPAVARDGVATFVQQLLAANVLRRVRPQ